VKLVSTVAIFSNRFVFKQSFQFFLDHRVVAVVAREARAVKVQRAKEGRAAVIAAVEKEARAARE
jgi:hypothetical protein